MEIRGRGNMRQKERSRKDSTFNCPGLKLTTKTVKNVQSRRQCLTKKQSKVRTEMRGGVTGEG